MEGNVFEKRIKKWGKILKKKLDKRGKVCYTVQAVRRHGSATEGGRKKIWASEKKSLTNRGQFAIITELLSGTGVRQLAAKKISKEIEKRA